MIKFRNYESGLWINLAKIATQCWIELLKRLQTFKSIFSQSFTINDTIGLSINFILVDRTSLSVSEVVVGI